MEIRSYRRVFDLERRIYRIDRLRLNPGGVPVRGIVYFMVALALALALGRLPLVHLLWSRLPWYLCDGALPAAVAGLLSIVRIEGRPFHLAALALARLAANRSMPVGIGRLPVSPARWCPEAIVLLPDGSDARMRRLLYTGPGAVLIRREHVRRASGPRAASRQRWPARKPTVIVEEARETRALDRGAVISLGLGTRMAVRLSRPA